MYSSVTWVENWRGEFIFNNVIVIPKNADVIRIPNEVFEFVNKHTKRYR